MRYFENENDGKQVEKLLKENGYEFARYFTEGIYDDLIVGSGTHRYVNLRFDTERGFHMSLTGTWVEGEGMKQVEEEAKKVNILIGELNKIVQK